MKRKRLIYGRSPVLGAIQSGESIDKVLVQKGQDLDFIKELRDLCKPGGVPIQMVPDYKLNKLVRKEHEGVIAIPAATKYYRIEDVLPMIYERGETPLLLALDGVTDVRNVGAIVRTAWGAGVHALIVPDSETAQLGEDAMRASAGTLASLTVCRHQSIHGAVKYLTLNGVKTLCASSKAEAALSNQDLKDPVCLVLGDEDRGVSKPVERICDTVVRLPILNHLDSYNVSVAAGMMLYEVMQQRAAS